MQPNAHTDFDIIRKLARESLSTYASIMHPSWEPNWHHRVIANIMGRVAAAAGGDDRYAAYRRVCIQMPPRAGKTELITKLFPGWYLAQHPYHNIISASYGAELADVMGRKAREYATSDTFQNIFDMGVSRLTNAITKWELENHAGFFATSVGAALTGWGTNCLILDDVLKNANDAASQTTKDSIWDWFMSTAYTRLEKNAATVVVMTRWAEDDLIGRLLAQNEDAKPADKWLNISFPMVAERDEKYRAKGEPLWPGKYDLEQCERIKAQVGKRVWAALYQQRPAPDEGAIFLKEYFRYYEVEDLDDIYFSAVFQSWDTGISAKETSARSACTTWGVVADPSVPGGSKFYLLNVYADQLAFPDLKRKVQELARLYSPDTVWVEEKATGRPIIDELRLAMGGLLKGVNPVGDKVQRAKAISAVFEAGRVFLPNGLPWVKDYLDELTTFPYGQYADKVDSTTQALRMMLKAQYQAARGRPGANPFSIYTPPYEPVSIFGR